MAADLLHSLDTPERMNLIPAEVSCFPPHMRTTSIRIGAVAALGSIALLLATPAYAYVDPGTGGMLVQLVTGGVAGLAVLGRLYWLKIRSRLFKDPSGARPRE